jgi:peptidase C13-like protein
MELQRLNNKTALQQSTGNFARNVFRNLITGAKAALLLPIQLDVIAASWLLITAALFLSILPTFISQWIGVGLAGELTVYGLQGVWYPFIIIVICTVIAAKLLGVQEKIKSLILLLLNAGIAIDTIIYILPLVLRTPLGRHLQQFIYGGLAGFWLGLVLTSALLRAQPSADKKARATAIAAGLAVAFSINGVWKMDTLWSVPYDEEQGQQEQADYYAVVSEDILYLQPKLLTEHLLQLQRGPAGANLYFLGVAGYAEQNVFVREIRSVEQLFLSKFTTEERSMLLINNTETLRSEPLATTTSLTASISRMAEVMDKDNDILFIYLTSHGSKEHRFSLHFAPLQLNDLEPAALRKMLDDAAIQWRVIVISACYSGGFIEPLASEKTLVITAAAADKTSFGCGDENDFTYFGKAYFEQALTRTNSFVEAFELAKVAVTERERAEDQEPSQPQISIGKDIGAKLESFRASIGDK